MKIILSPTKTMKLKEIDLNITTPIYQDKSEELRNILKSKNKDELKELYKSSDKIIDQCYEFYQNAKDGSSALSLYDGLVFKQLDLSTYDDSDLDYMNDHLRILSALYGVLKVSDNIQSYRLDYLMKFDLDLYKYWDKILSKYFEDEDLIINLASNEFSKSFKHDNMININFVDKDLKSKSTAAKMARGNILDYLVKNKIKDKESIKKYSNLNYRFSSEHSDDYNYYFIMED